MSWLTSLLLHPTAAQQSAHTLLALSMIISLGVLFGSLRIVGISFGVAGALFVGLVFGHFGITGEKAVMEFTQNLGLVLFVYSIGVAVGPSFAASLRSQGLRLNLLTATIVLVGVAATLVIGRCLMPHSDWVAIVGMFCGASTSTPSLGATKQAVMSLSSNPSIVNMPVLGYAVAYPFGVIGIILSMYIIRWVFRIDLVKEKANLAASAGVSVKKLDTLNIEVTNKNLDGMTVADLIGMQSKDVVVSRIGRGDEMLVALADTTVLAGDVLLAVGPSESLENLERIVGSKSDINLKEIESEIIAKNLIVSKKDVVGVSIPDLNLTSRFHVTATRILRGDVELPATQSVKLQFGDRVTVVGAPDHIKRAEKEFGNSASERDKPMMLPLFTGLIIGVLLGSIPINIPGFPAPVTLGLAGGPLVTAIILSAIGKIGGMVWYMPRSANLMLRQIGIVMFLACVGLNAGGEFVPDLQSGHGIRWMEWGILVTLLPLLSVSFYARGILKMNYMTLCGLMAGSLTDTAALTFALQATGSEAPSLSYATVYPMAVLLRVFAVQAMILFFK